MASSRGSSKGTRARASAKAGRRTERAELPQGQGPEQKGRPLAARSAFELRSLLWSLFLALAFWGLAIIFYVSLQRDPNRVLYAAMAAFLALLWTVNFSFRLSRRRRR
ncbi:hypothetical protein A4R35_11410 [Thermogemmatispora tikiterensis]|uniref:Uncharacterized protein n=1 Tax=Thermogemmatispora tikiterensis TaxID=1825093 RepID=A0A328VKR0_9CHLR|nr:hypothetical protein A4R35_11410 [Thermogemmatispora tikiterensis]